ncbi:MAG: hypothetical protein BWZ01_02483 [Deltaproteobacteria bacterium ADurb.BinA179]|nr:MAG: hypothetical protein BWZ01_02483 [Deltaproteobacteria bacterium ADurb.BinA179]
MDTDAPSPYLVAVDHHVVCLGSHLPRIAREKREIVGHGRGERVVHRNQALVLLAPLKQGKIGHPQCREGVRIDETEAPRHMKPECAQARVCRVLRGCDDQGDVARLHVQALPHGIEPACLKELGQARLPAVALQAGPEDAFCSEIGHHVRKRIEVFPAEPVGGLDRERLDHAAFSKGGREHPEIRSGHDVGDILELHAEAGIRPVGAVILHGLLVGHPPERNRQVHSDGFPEEVHDHGLGYIQDIVHLDERHLDIDLGELGLPVRSQVFVSEALDDLVIAVKARNHEKLLEELGRLGKRIAFARKHAARHQIVPGPFRGALGEDRSLHVDETVAVQIPSDAAGGPVPENNVALKRGSAQIQVAVFQPEDIVRFHRVFQNIRGCLCLVQNRKLPDNDLHVPGEHARVTHVFGAHLYLPL